MANNEEYFDEQVQVEVEVEDWDDWESDNESSSDYFCLFCDSKFESAITLFGHCKSQHCFDFRTVVGHLELDFYGSMKLINYVRSQVAKKKCWSCGLAFESSEDLLGHLHAPAISDALELLWEDDAYLKPFMEDDALLHSFADDDEDDKDDEDYTKTISKEEVMRELMNNGSMAEIGGDCCKVEEKEDAVENMAENSEKVMSNGSVKKETNGRQHEKHKDLKVSFANVAAREIKNVNDNYFGAYGSFSIHREMISDKVRTEAYRDAIVTNPSLLKQSTVVDVGCGTGILSLFAAQAGASRVIAVEASAKMASVATQIAKDNGLLSEENEKGQVKWSSGVINVVQTMVEDLDNCIQIQPHSVDVIVSEWMGYCLLYESMLTSVLYARDRWLKPGGAILPDTATIFAAGFGRGGTRPTFWENVYGFNMSCIGKELVEDAAKVPIVDVVDSGDIVTESAPLKFFDLATMRPDDMDFTATCELELKSDLLEAASNETSTTCWCHGIVLWFETGFTSRFCKEMPVVLSTSPHTPRTHWSQTILTFQEPIAMTSDKSISDPAGAVGSEGCPVVRIRSRISIVRSSQHRSIDISLETWGLPLMEGRLVGQFNYSAYRVILSLCLFGFSVLRQ